MILKTTAGRLKRGDVILDVDARRVPDGKAAVYDGDAVVDEVVGTEIRVRVGHKFVVIEQDATVIVERHDPDNEKEQ